MSRGLSNRPSGNPTSYSKVVAPGSRKISMAGSHKIERSTMPDAPECPHPVDRQITLSMGSLDPSIADGLYLGSPL